MIKVLIADDHTVVRKGLLQILSNDPSIKVMDEAVNGFEALEKARANKYDILILDISMPGMSGIEVLQQIKSEMLDIPVLVLSIYPEEQYAIRVLKDGAAGYMTKEAAPEELIDAVKRITQGRKYISEEIAEKLAFYVESGEGGSLHEHLSDREFSILLMITSGKANKEIASDLGLSPKTISTYRSRILEKMHMETNAQLMHYAITQNLI